VSDARLDALFGLEPPPRVRGAHCRRRRAGHRGCRACVMVCPTDALWTDAHGRLRLTEVDCVGCGACASVCPTQAIDAAGAPDLTAAWRRAAADGAAGRLALGCRLGSDRGRQADATLPCLVALHPERLAGLLLAYPDVALRVHVGPCAACPIGHLRPLIEAQVAQATAFAALLGVTPRVAWADGTSAPATPALSRRAVLGLAREQATRLAAQALAEAALVGDVGAAGEALPHRERLLAAARHRARELAGPVPTQPVPGAFFVDWDVADRCDGCAGIPTEGRSNTLAGAPGDTPRCVAACPGGAWRMARRPDGATLSHDAARCTACGLCAERCPRDALRPLPARVTADAGRSPKRTLPTRRCRGCHRPIVAGGDGLCGNCRKRLGAIPGGGTTPG